MGIFFPEFAQVLRRSVGQGRGPVRNGGGYRACRRPQPGDTYRNCGRKGHWARKCRRAEEYESAPEELRFVGGSVSIITNGRNGTDTYLALSLNGRRIYELLDTGCNTSVISRRAIPNKLLKLTTQKLFAANETEIVLVGEVELTLVLAGHEVTAAWWSPRRWMT